jgi:predicted O-methyltransferase YrrM
MQVGILARARRVARSWLRRLFDRRIVWVEVRPYHRPKLDFEAIPIEPGLCVTARGYHPCFVTVRRSLADSARRSNQVLSQLTEYGGEPSERKVTHDPWGNPASAPMDAGEDFKRITTGLDKGQQAPPDRDRFHPRRFLYFLMLELQPDRVLELGTAHGLSGLHIIAALEASQRGHLNTVELDPTRRALAVTAFERFFPGSNRWTSVESSFSDGLPGLAEDVAPIDVIFEDGPHTYEATMEAFEGSIACLKPGGLYIVDDICFDPQQEQAWVAIRNDRRIEASLEVNARFGLCIRSAD